MTQRYVYAPLSSGQKFDLLTEQDYGRCPRCHVAANKDVCSWRCQHCGFGWSEERRILDDAPFCPGCSAHLLGREVVFDRELNTLQCTACWLRTLPPVVIAACGCCGGFHRAGYLGACRNPEERFASLAEAADRLQQPIVEFVENGAHGTPLLPTLRPLQEPPRGSE